MAALSPTFAQTNWQQQQWQRQQQQMQQQQLQRQQQEQAARRAREGRSTIKALADAE